MKINAHCDDDRFHSAHLQSRVGNIHICGYRNEENADDKDGNPPTNYWAACLQLSQGGSVRLDTITGYGSDGLRGKVDIPSKAYVFIFIESFETAV